MADSGQNGDEILLHGEISITSTQWTLPIFPQDQSDNFLHNIITNQPKIFQKFYLGQNYLEWKIKYCCVHNEELAFANIQLAKYLQVSNI